MSDPVGHLGGIPVYERPYLAPGDLWVMPVSGVRWCNECEAFKPSNHFVYVMDLWTGNSAIVHRRRE